MPDMLIAVDIRATVLADITKERIRQVSKLGYNEDHDDEENSHQELSQAAACYALAGGSLRKIESGQHNEDGYAVPHLWPERWDTRHWKPKDMRSNLIRAAALLVAEIERLDRERIRGMLGEAIKKAGF